MSSPRWVLLVLLVGFALLPGLGYAIAYDDHTAEGPQRDNALYTAEPVELREAGDTVERYTSELSFKPSLLTLTHVGVSIVRRTGRRGS